MCTPAALFNGPHRLFSCSDGCCHTQLQLVMLTECRVRLFQLWVDEGLFFFVLTSSSIGLEKYSLFGSEG